MKSFFGLAKFFPFILIYMICGSCYNDSDELGDLLQRAGNNRGELETAIRHYKGDSLKSRALYFLIKNMPYHFSYSGESLTHHNQIFNLIENSEKISPYTGNYVFPETDKMWDSLDLRYGKIDMGELKSNSDLNTISSKLLIENIDFAFRTWEMPWAKHLNFDEFCELLLPYRFKDEELESWRPFFFKKYSWVLDSMNGSNDPVRACELVNNDIKKWFRFNGLFNSYPVAISPGNLMRAKMGRCLDQAGIATFAMRAIGIPVAHEYVPQWADRSMGHDFSSVLSKNMEYVDFLGGELSPGKNEIRNRAPKIYRATFSQQDNPLLYSTLNKSDVPYVFNNFFMKDVSSIYVKTSDIKIVKHGGSSDKSKFMFLAVFNDREWIPVASSEIVNGVAYFKNMGRDIIYLPCYFLNNEVQAASDPFVLRSEGRVTTCKVNQSYKEMVSLERKYPLLGYKKNWLLWMENGIFQGANTSNFSDAKNLLVLGDSLKMIMNKVPISEPGSYQYLRYLFPDNSSGSLSEIAFYTDSLLQSTELKGRKIKSKKVDSLDLEHAFDKKFQTYIDRTPSNEYDGQWIGLNLGKRHRITSVGFSPRNDQNNITKGMKYELLYWDKHWNSLGVKIAVQDNELVYKEVPSNSVLLLRNLTEGKEERIFLYRNGHQIWY